MRFDFDCGIGVDASVFGAKKSMVVGFISPLAVANLGIIRIVESMCRQRTNWYEIIIYMRGVYVLGRRN